MRQGLLLRIVWVFVGLVFLGSAAWLMRSYLTSSENAIKVITDTRDQVYKELRSEWLRPRVADLTEGTAADPVDQFDVMALRTALGRWRLRQVAPHAYFRLEEAFEYGRWTGDWKRELREKMEAIDEAWLRARGKVLAGGDVPSTPTLRVLPQRGMQIQFGAGTVTSQLGSIVIIDFVANQVPTRKRSAFAVWGTKNFPETSPARIRGCMVVRTGQRSGGRHVYRLTMDMSAEPVWLDPQCEPLWISLHGDGDTSWRPLSVRFHDSEHLRPTFETHRFVP